MAKGKVEGLAQGKAEVATNLLAIGMNIEAISQATGLSIDAIKKLPK